MHVPRVIACPRYTTYAVGAHASALRCTTDHTQVIASCCPPCLPQRNGYPYVMWTRDIPPTTAMVNSYSAWPFVMVLESGKRWEHVLPLCHSSCGCAARPAASASGRWSWGSSRVGGGGETSWLLHLFSASHCHFAAATTVAAAQGCLAHCPHICLRSLQTVLPGVRCC